MTEVITRTRVPITSIYVNPANYKVHPRVQLDELKSSLRRFGQVEPAVVKQQTVGTYLLVAHEGVTLAGKELYKEDPLAYQHFYQWAVVIVPEDWSEEQVEGYMVASNETMTKAEVNDHKLAALLKRQHEYGFDLASLGIDQQEYQVLLRERDAFPTTWAAAEETEELRTWEKKPPSSPTPLHALPKQEKAGAPQASIPIDQEAWKLNQTELRQLVLVSTPERYRYFLAAFGSLREREGLGSHADVVFFLLQQYLAGHPECRPAEEGGEAHVSH